MDFIVGLPQTPKGHDLIWVIIDRLTKVAHFVAVRTDYRVEKLSDLYVDNILILHGAPISIVSIKGRNGCPNSRRVCTKLSGLDWIIAPLTTLR